MDMFLQNLHSNRKKEQVELSLTKHIHKKIFKIQYLFTDRRLVKIIILHRCRLPKVIMEKTIFLKMQNFCISAFLCLINFTAAKKKKECKQNFTENPHFLCFS